MDNKEYRESRGTNKECTALVLPVGNKLIKGWIYDEDNMLIFSVEKCKHCGFESHIDDQICINCFRERK